MKSEHDEGKGAGRALGRLHEVDLARGLAVTMMLVSNFLFDLYFFCGLPLSPHGRLGWLSRATAGFFLLLVGVSLHLSQQRGGRGATFGGCCRRGLGLLGLGLLVSAATWFTADEQLVVFGVLHCIGLAVIISYPLLRRPKTSAAFGVLLIAAAPLARGASADHFWLLWLGVQPAGFQSVDYVPLVPWAGLVFLGIFCGTMLFPAGLARFPFSSQAFSSGPARWLIFLGQRSLIVYFAHQPVFLALLWLWARVAG